MSRMLLAAFVVFLSGCATLNFKPCPRESDVTAGIPLAKDVGHEVLHPKEDLYLVTSYVSTAGKVGALLGAALNPFASTPLYEEALSDAVVAQYLQRARFQANSAMLIVGKGVAFEGSRGVYSYQLAINTPFIQFDLSSVPSGATIKKASLFLYPIKEILERKKKLLSEDSEIYDDSKLFWHAITPDSIQDAINNLSEKIPFLYLLSDNSWNEKSKAKPLKEMLGTISFAKGIEGFKIPDSPWIGYDVTDLIVSQMEKEKSVSFLLSFAEGNADYTAFVSKDYVALLEGNVEKMLKANHPNFKANEWFSEKRPALIVDYLKE